MMSTRPVEPATRPGLEIEGFEGVRVLAHCQKPETAAEARGFFAALGTSFREAANQDDMVSVLREWLPDIVLLETGPPAPDLAAVCGCLRAIGEDHWRPLVALLPENDAEARSSAAECRFDAFIEYPIVPARAERQLAALLAHRPTRASSALSGASSRKSGEIPVPASLRSTPPDKAGTGEIRVAPRDWDSEEPEAGSRPGGPSHRTIDILRRLDGSRRFTEALLAQIHSGVVAADDKGRITFANRSALETLGLDIIECVGRDLVTTFGGSRDLSRALISVAGGGETRSDLTIKTKSGSRLDLGMTVLRTTEMAPPDMAFVLLFRDVSDRRQFEMELRRVERISAIGNMVAGFAHEIRNPLAGIQALAEALLLDLPSDDRLREYPERMLALLSRVEQFVNATLRFGEPKPARHSRQNAESIARNAIESLSSRWGRRGSAPALSVAPSVPALHCDEGQITEALLALVENAIDAAGDPARVRIAVKVQPAEGLLKDADRLVRFDVMDDGPGVPEALLARIFDPFFTTKANGTGLGLPLAQNLVRENGGRLLVASNPGSGSTFSLLLPEANS